MQILRDAMSLEDRELYGGDIGEYNGGCGCGCGCGCTTGRGCGCTCSTGRGCGCTFS